MAQELANNTFYDFMYGKFLLMRLFNIDLHADDYVEDAYNVFRDIGNIAIAHHAFRCTADEMGEVILPCNVEFIEAVTTNQKIEHDGLLINISQPELTYNPNSFIPGIITSKDLPEDFFYTELHPAGDFIPYELIGNKGGKKIRVQEESAGKEITVIYRGIVMDDDGNPCITRKEADAIAYKIAFMETQKKTFLGDPQASSLLSYIKGESATKMQSAKIPEYLSQNFLNSLLDAKVSHGRKIFNSSYKTLK